MSFEGQVAVVTGGGSGIGRAAVLLLASQGAAVAVADIDRAAAARVAAEVTAAGGRTVAVEVDVTDAAQVRAMAAEAERTLGPIDVLVSNAGWDEVAPFVETEEGFWDRVIAINFRGHLATTRAVLPGMIERGRGRIVTVASDAGRVGSSGEAVYSGAKGAVIAFSKALAREVARKGIAVNCVAPGLTDTPLLTRLTEGHENLMGAIVKSIPMGRLGRPEEVARAIAFLASGEAEYITGQTLSVNGGLSMV
jgi:2-hydroxycyclohexanecarboxyl-CoA dehydrogenase